MKPQFLIAAPSSNSGKTTITLALLRLLHDRGFIVQPFKCGPDYLDPKHHTLAARRQSINLDTFMMSEPHVKQLYAEHTKGADVALVEGVMGLFDGANRMKGSSAEIALLLNLPVILVVNAKAMAYSVAPLLFGFKHFHKDLKLVGVIFNFVNTESHYQFLKEACEDVGVEALGYVPVNDALRIPERYLGLSISADHDYETLVAQAALHVEKRVDVDRIFAISDRDILEVEDHHSPKALSSKKLRISVARDEAFNFIYYQNIEALKGLGEVTFFSPLRDSVLPETDLLYLAGGYPELFLQELSGNEVMKEAIHAFCSNGGKVIAECGGMMYLGKVIVDKQGNRFAMAGFLDLETSMVNAKLTLGYRTIHLNGQVLKGHEFHYSNCHELGTIHKIGEVKNARGMVVNTPVYQQQQVLASYIHVYWAEDNSLVALLNDVGV